MLTTWWTSENNRRFISQNCPLKLMKMELGLSKTLTYLMLNEHLVLWKVYARFVPHKLTDNQKFSIPKISVRWSRRRKPSFDLSFSYLLFLFNILLPIVAFVLCHLDLTFHLLHLKWDIVYFSQNFILTFFNVVRVSSISFGVLRHPL